jgi:hypothetical protein
MKLSLRKFLLAAAMTLAGIQVGQAEEIQLAPQFDPFIETASATTTFEAPPAISLVNYAGGCADNACNSGACCQQQPHVGKDFYVCQDRTCDWYASFELLMLRPYAGGQFMNPGNTNAAQLGFDGGARFVAGRQNSDGLGGRLRYFVYDQSNTFGGGIASIETRYFDAELTQAVNFRKWGFVASGGLRYLMWDGMAGTPATLNNIGFDGLGLTTSIEASRALRMQGGRMVATARWSALYGNSKAAVIAGAAPAAGATPQNDDVVNMLELNIGPQFTRKLRNATLVLGGGLEAQVYSNITNIAAGPGSNVPGASDFGLAGFTSSIMLMR